MTVQDQLRTALQVVLDHVDYTAGACRMTEMIGACLPREVLTMAHSALAADRTVVPAPEGEGDEKQ